MDAFDIHRRDQFLQKFQSRVGYYKPKTKYETGRNDPGNRNPKDGHPDIDFQYPTKIMEPSYVQRHKSSLGLIVKVHFFRNSHLWAIEKVE
jgi:hypothetical protein